MSSSLTPGSSYKYTPSETDITDVDDDQQRLDEHGDKEATGGLRRFTRAELMAFDGQTPGHPIYVAVLGNVYDVSDGRKFYGPGTNDQPAHDFSLEVYTYQVCRFSYL